MDTDILRSFRIKGPCSVCLLHGENVYLVDCADGQFVLKRIGKDQWGLEKMLEEHRLLKYLFQKGIPVAPPVDTLDGVTYLEREDAYFVLTPKLTFSHVDFFSPQSHALYFEIGRAIAFLHRALEAYPDPIHSFEIEPALILNQGLIPWFKEHSEDVECKNVSDALLTARDELTKALGDLPRQRIHGDCHTGNICIDGCRVTGFTDCDHLPIGPRIFDLCEYLIHIVKWDLGDEEKTRSFLSNYSALIEGYDAVNPLTEKELRSIWHMLLYLQLIFYRWKIKNGRSDAAVDMKAFWWIFERKSAFSRDRISVQADDS